MGDYIIQKQFNVVIAGLTLCIIGYLSGGFGNAILDKFLHILVFVTVIFVTYYYVILDKKQHKLKIISLMVLTLIYSTLVNPFLVLIAILPLGAILVLKRNIEISAPLLDRDSPLLFGIKHIPIWVMVLTFVYCVSVFFV